MVPPPSASAATAGPSGAAQALSPVAPVAVPPVAVAPVAPRDVVARLRGSAADRPAVDPTLSGGIRAWLEDGMADLVAARPAGAPPVVVTTRSMAEGAGPLPGDPEAAGPGPAPALSGPQVLGVLVSTLFRQVVTTGAVEDPLDDALAGLETDGGRAEVCDFVGDLPAASVATLVRDLEVAAGHLVRDWSRVSRWWLPRTAETVCVPLAGGRVLLSASLDLALGAPSRGAASTCLVEVRSGARRSTDRLCRRYHALLETLRTGAPPFRVATYYTRDGSMAVDDVDDELLTGIVDTVVHTAADACRRDPSPPAPGPPAGRPVAPPVSGWAGAAACTVVPPATLPRAAALTDALTAPCGPPLAADTAAALEQQLTVALATVAPPADGRRRTVDGYVLGREEHASAPGAFRWTARAARRSVALAALGACLRGECRTPGDAVRRAVEQAAGQAGLGRSGWASLGVWLAALPAGGRAAVEAEAVRWATTLLGALEWDRLGPALEVGGPDRWWNLPGRRWLSLRGRADVRAAAGDRPVLACVLPGRPGPSSRAELLLPALVDVLSEPGGPAPARVLGWWPASGRTLVVPVDAPGLHELVGRVVAHASRAAGGSPAVPGDRSGVASR